MAFRKQELENAPSDDERMDVDQPPLQATPEKSGIFFTFLQPSLIERRKKRGFSPTSAY